MPAYKDTKTGKWYCKFYYQTSNGRKQKLKRGFDLKRQAEQYEREYIAVHNCENTVLLKDLVPAFLEDLEKKGRAVSTLNVYKINLNHLISKYGDLQAEQITAENVEEIINDITADFKTNTRSLFVKICTSLYSFGVKKYKLSLNPFQKIEKPAEKTTANNFWTLEQFQDFKKSCEAGDIHLLALEIIYYTGLRRGELMALTVSDIDLNNNKLTVNATRDHYGRRKPKTDSSARVVYLAPYVTGLFRDLIAGIYNATPETLLFPFSPNALNLYFKRQIKAAGLPEITVHGLRHSHASLLINNNATIHDIADRLGHSSPIITANVYTHMFNDRRQALANDLQKIIDKNENK